MKVNKSELVSIVVPAGNTKTQIYFPDEQNLRNKSITGIEYFAAAMLSRSLDQTNAVQYAQIKSTLVFFNFENGDYLQFPLASLMATKDNSTSANTFYRELPYNLNGQIISWTKSYLVFNPIESGSFTNAASFNFMVTYND
jgi:hypothetical protein